MERLVNAAMPGSLLLNDQLSNNIAKEEGWQRMACFAFLGYLLNH